jgi:RimJ/RimL family protein N-acetyltransferase
MKILYLFTKTAKFLNLALIIEKLKLYKASLNSLTTNRLSIEKASLEDAPFILALVNSPNWLAFIGDRDIKTLADAKNYIQKSLIDSYAQNGFGLYKVSLKASGEPIGICGFLQRDYLDYPDLGFATLPKYEGKGYTYEAAKACLVYAKSQLSFTTILAVTTAENTKSKNLLTKLEFTADGKVTPDESGKEFLVFTNTH